MNEDEDGAGIGRRMPKAPGVGSSGASKSI